MESKIIENRLIYLKDQLRNLPDDWCGPGESYAPSHQIINFVSSLLTNLNIHNIQFEKLLMGPMPAGGIGIEIVKEEGTQIDLMVYNIREIYIEYEENGQYEDNETYIGPNDFLVDTVIHIIKLYSNGHF